MKKYTVFFVRRFGIGTHLCEFCRVKSGSEIDVTLRNSFNVRMFDSDDLVEFVELSKKSKNKRME